LILSDWAPTNQSGKPSKLTRQPATFHNQRREVEANNIHLQFDSVGVLDHGAYDGLLDFAVMQVHAYFVIARPGISRVFLVLT
jgi:hypothetical protein